MGPHAGLCTGPLPALFCGYLLPDGRALICKLAFLQRSNVLHDLAEAMKPLDGNKPKQPKTKQKTHSKQTEQKHQTKTHKETETKTDREVTGNPVGKAGN